MVSQSRTAHPSELQRPFTSQLPRQRRLGRLQVVTVLTVMLTVLVLAAIALVRTDTIPQLVDLPPLYRPGRPLPQDVACTTDDEPTFCAITYQGHSVSLDYDPSTQMIIHSSLPIPGYTLGQLMLAWGTPTGMRWLNHTIYIYWGSKVAVLDGPSFQPHTTVQAIVYVWYGYNEARWPGFRRHTSHLGAHSANDFL